MAIIRATENKISAAIRKERRRLTRWVLWIGLPAVVAASFMWPDLLLVWVVPFIVSLKLARCAGSSMELAGAAGEERALAVLSGLPDEYALFNQIRFPDERSSTGYREADFILAGPNGVFILENKDYLGWIKGDENSDEWELHKTGRRGEKYMKAATRCGRCGSTSPSWEGCLPSGA